MNELTSTLTNNVSAIVMAGIFMWYLNKRDTSFQGTLDRLSDAIHSLEQKLNQKQDKQIEN